MRRQVWQPFGTPPRKVRGVRSERGAKKHLFAVAHVIRCEIERLVSVTHYQVTGTFLRTNDCTNAFRKVPRTLSIAALLAAGKEAIEPKAVAWKLFVEMGRAS